MKKPPKRLLSTLLPASSSGSMIEPRLRGIPFVFKSDKEFADWIVILSNVIDKRKLMFLDQVVKDDY